jgi:hypothetical protein
MIFNIFDSLIALALRVFNLLISMLPYADQRLNDYIAQNGALFMGYLGTANWFFPVPDFVMIIGGVLSIESAFFTYKLITAIASQATLGVVQK